MQKDFTRAPNAPEHLAIWGEKPHLKHQLTLLRQWGFTLHLVGGGGSAQPPARCTHALIRRAACSGSARDAAFAWAKGAGHVLIEAPSPKPMTDAMVEAGLLVSGRKAAVEPTLEGGEQAQDPKVPSTLQRSDLDYDEAFIEALFNLAGNKLGEDVVQTIYTEQGCSYQPEYYASAALIWDAKHPEVQRTEEVEEPPVVAKDTAPTGPYLDDIKPGDFDTKIAWCRALVEADQRITTDDCATLAARHGTSPVNLGTFSTVARQWRVAHGLSERFPTVNCGVPWPVAWEESWGRDPEKWPRANLKPLPTIPEMQKEIDGWLAEVARLEARVQELEAGASGSEEKKYTDLKAALQGTNEKLVATRRELVETDKLLKDARDEQMRAETARDEAKTELRTAQQKLAEAEERLKVLTSNANAAQLELLDLREQVKDPNAEAERLARTLKAREDAIKALKTKISQLETEQSDDLSAAEARVKELEEKVKELEAAVGKGPQKVTEALRAAQRELAEVREMHVLMQDRAEKMEKERDSIHADYSELVALSLTHAKECDDLRGANNQLKVELDNLRARQISGVSSTPASPDALNEAWQQGRDSINALDVALRGARLLINELNLATNVTDSEILGLFRRNLRF